MRLLFGCLFWVGSAVPVCGQVVLSEVMFDPAGSEFFDEFIEIHNLGNDPVDLSGWRVGDGDQADAILPFEGGTLLGPGAFGLILDAGYFEQSSQYEPLPEAALVLTVDSPTLGREGLSNRHSETVILISAGGDTAASMAYRPGNLPGVSEEKIDPAGGDGAQNWTDARWMGGTPGRINSVSPKDEDLVLRQISESPFRVPAGGEGGFGLMVVNEGKRVAGGFEVRVHGMLEGWMWQSGDLAPGDSIGLTVPISSGVAGPAVFEAFLAFEADQDTTNNGAKWDVIFGAFPGDVVVNEVMFLPEPGGSEWVELLNRSGKDLYLSGWRLQDDRPGSGVGFSSESFVLRSDAYVVVAQDEAGFRAGFPGAPVLGATPWPRLNNGGDAVVLKDGTGAVVDSIVYDGGGDPGRSLERIDAAGQGGQNWLWSTDARGATPGARNSVAAPDQMSGVQIQVSPNPFRERAEITYSLPVVRANVTLWVFDRLGNQVRTLLQGDPGGGERRVVWDGKGAQGQALKPGIYILYLEAGASEGRVFRARAPVVLAKGLD